MKKEMQRNARKTPRKVFKDISQKFDVIHTYSSTQHDDDINNYTMNKVSNNKSERTQYRSPSIQTMTLNLFKWNDTKQKN